MQRHNVTKEDARKLIQAETGLAYPFDEIVVVHPNDFYALVSVANPASVYYGDIVVQSYLPFATSVTLQLTKSGLNKTTLEIQAILEQNPKGSVIHNVMWDSVQDLQTCNIHFYGWKFTRARGYVVQSYTLTPGAGWTESGGDYTHTVGSGTTEQIYLGAWALNSLIRVTVTFTGITQGSLSLEMDTSGTFGTISEDGTYTFVVQTTGTDGALFFVPTTDFDGTYNENSVIIEKETYI